ncbi:MAG: hypothetical protein IKF51_07730 [Solobacterium sp.]|nr:hypothetical protein [Solobacterium sp.]
MDNAKKHLKKELLRAKKNPGKKNRQARKEANAAKRGTAAPGVRVVETKPAKARRRSNLKIELQRAVRDCN